jgi:glutamyl-tRNA reductase
MKLVCFGLNHRSAPVRVREGWALSAEEARRALQGLRGHVAPSEHLILCTCNRTEFYSHIPFTRCPGAEELAGRHAAGPEALNDPGTRAVLIRAYARFYAEFCRQATQDRTGIADLLDDWFDPEHFYIHVQDTALHHVFRLAGGLDSMILGEPQILRQLKDAYAVAREADSVGRFFHRLVPAALRVGKKVRSLTAIAAGCITPGQAALRLARQTLGNLTSRSLLVIGSGKIAASAALAFAAEPLSRRRVINRTEDRARELVERLGAGETLPWGHLEAALAEADIVVSSTGAVQPIVESSMLARVQERRGGRPLVVVDLAIPRDFAPESGDIPGVHLHNIDDLNQVIQDNVAQRHSDLPLAEEIILEETRIFQRQTTYLQVDPVLRHMAERFEQIRLGELQAHISQFPPELHDSLQQLTSSIVKKLLNFPIEKLKSLRDLRGLSDAEIGFLKRLFMTDI